MKKLKKKDLIVVIIFLLLFLFGLPFFSKINGNIDEKLEQKIVLENLSGYAHFFKNNELYTSLGHKGVVPIYFSVEEDHGVAPYYPLIPLLMLRDSIPNTVTNIWHFYMFIIFFISTIFFYKTINLMFNNNKLSLLMTILYYFSPRIFIDAFHNNKDITLMSLLIITSYYLIKIMKRSNNKDMIKFAIMAALLSNVKIIGVFFTGIMGLEYIIYLLIHKKMSKEKIIDISFIFLLYLLLFFIITPAIWTGGLRIKEYFTYCLDNSTNFSRWNGTILFEGVYYTIRVGDRLPWYYLPKTMVITLPLVITILFITSLLFFIFSFIKKIIKRNKLLRTDYHFVGFIIMFLIPFIVCLVSKPNIYNGWRHFYFLYGLILLISSYLVNIIWNKKYKYIIVIIICISIGTSIYNLTRYGIRNTSYYNLLVGNKDISSKYEMDYYNVTAKDAINKFIKKIKISKKDKVYLYPYGIPVTQEMMGDTINRSYNLSERIIMVDKEDIEELIEENKKIYLISNTVYEYDDLSFLDLQYTYKYKNNKVINFYLVDKNNYEALNE